MDVSVSELLNLCIVARRDGQNFPDIWKGVLATHPLVAGIPRSSGGVLSVPLTTGDRLLFGEDFSVEKRDP